MERAEKRFRHVALAEGWSYLALVLVAMPLKYFADFPMAVRVVGMLHGLLFIALVVTLAPLFFSGAWRLGRCLLGFGLSLVPFGAFLFEAHLRRHSDPRKESENV